MEAHDFVERVIESARADGFRIELNRYGLTQIDFCHKKLHAQHLLRMLPEILFPDANVAKIIEKTAPGRPCTHRPMKRIISRVLSSGQSDPKEYGA